MKQVPRLARKASVISALFLVFAIILIMAPGAGQASLSGTVPIAGAIPGREGTATSSPTWAEIPNMPSVRAHTSLAYDSASQSILLFGGFGSDGNPAANAGQHNDLWSWSGAAWQQLTPAKSPPNDQGPNTPALAYDAARGNLVLLDQWDTPAQTWVWDGTTWTQKAPVVSPTSGSPALMAYDSAHQVIVLLESQTLPNGLNVIVTWTWDGTNWTKHTAATTPPAGQGQSVAGDAASGQVVLFGGLLLDSSHRGLTNATWTWDGTTWTEQFPANSLSARWGQSIAYDSTHEAVVLVGGSSSTEAFTDTWTWDGTNWTQRVPAMAPALGGPIADDPLDGGVLMFGGPSPSDQTWHWNGTVWSQVIPTPLGRHGAAFGYDAATSNVVLFGGCCYSNGHLFADTWVRNGLGWRPIHPAVSPSSRVNPSMAYDAVSQKVVLFGGCATDGPPSTALGDTWSWDGTTWQQLTSSSPGPQAQCGAALASIGNRSGHPSILLFGSDGTWIWQNNWWHQPSLSASPPLQDNDALSVDPTTGTALLLGAPTGGSTCGCYDTWQWNGATWIQRFPTASPPNITASPRMAYDAAIGRTILFLSAGPDQTWSWTGSNWIQLFPINTTWLVTGPPAMAYNAKTKQLLLFGGKDFNSKDQDATWVLGSGS